jgi:hypothetical protein
MIDYTRNSRLTLFVAYVMILLTCDKSHGLSSVQRFIFKLSSLSLSLCVCVCFSLRVSFIGRRRLTVFDETQPASTDEAKSGNYRILCAHTRTHMYMTVSEKCKRRHRHHRVRRRNLHKHSHREERELYAVYIHELYIMYLRVCVCMCIIWCELSSGTASEPCETYSPLKRCHFCWR